MPKAKTIDRVEFTKSRTIRRTDDGKVIAPPPIEIIESLEYDEERGVIVEHKRQGAEICPMCGAVLIHESGCVRCTCGWSRC